MLTYDDCEKIYNEHIAAEELCEIWGGDAGVTGYVDYILSEILGDPDPVGVTDNLARQCAKEAIKGEQPYFDEAIRLLMEVRKYAQKRHDYWKEREEELDHELERPQVQRLLYGEAI